MSILTIPYKVGIVGGMAAAVATVPLCFDLNTALWFNECYVTTDVPEGKDLETWLEVRCLTSQPYSLARCLSTLSCSSPPLPLHSTLPPLTHPLSSLS
jgi:hypothetical protein